MESVKDSKTPRKGRIYFEKSYIFIILAPVI